MQRPTERNGASVVAGCGCACSVGSPGRGIQKGTAVKVVVAGRPLGDGIF